MKTHYYPWGFSDNEERSLCGVWFGEASNISSDWERVTCGRCLRLKKQIKSRVVTEEKAIVDEMGDMADFMSTQQV